MNAVEKLGSFISRGVYTVSGPFHPFGGAVDIIVVQQPDGSFKSSPWYVRFGKFQGVFNMKEKIVSICVNGAEAEFHMYLDHKGEAHFLRESEAEEEESAGSPPNSGDEVEERSGNAQLRKIQNCNSDGIMSDLVAPNGTGNGKILIRTDSQRSRIPGGMFSRRSMKGSDQDEGVGRVNSLERAEIAANLLELNWSTNLLDRKGSQKKHADKKHVPPKKPAIEKGERHQITSLDVEHDPEEKIHSSRGSIGDNLETSIIRREILEERTICNSVNLRREEMINEVNTSESEGTTLCAVCIDQRPKKLVENSISDSSGARMNTANHPLVTNSCGNMVEVHFEESISQISVSSALEEVLEICTSEIGGSEVRNELTSNSVDVEQSEVKGESNPREVIFNVQSSDAPVVQALKETLEAAAVEVSDTENGEQEAMCCKKLESSTVISGISYEKTSSATHLTFPPNSSLADEFKEHYEVLDVVSSAGLHQNLDFTRFGVSSLSRNVQTEPLNVAFLNVGVSADFCPSQNACLMRSDFENICQDIVNEELNQKVERSAIYFSFPGSQQKEEPLHLFSNAILLPDHSTGSDSESKSYYTGNFCDSLNESAQLYKVERFKENGVKESCLSNMVNKSEDSDASSRPIEEVEVRVKSTESSEEDDFLFNDIDGFIPYKTRLDVSFGPVNDKGKPPLLYAEGDDVEEHPFKDASDAESSEGLLDDSNTQTSPMTIPRKKIYLEDSQISAKSLPAIRSHIHDLERSHQPYSLSSSLNLPSEKKNGDSSMMECFETLTKDDGSQSKVMQKNCTYEAVAAALDTKNHHKLKDNAVRPVVELSLCRNLLYEGMGSDAAFQAFNSEKVTLEKFYALGPSMLKNDKLVARMGGHYFPGNSAAPINLQIIAFGQESILEPQDVITVEHVEKNCKEDAFATRIPSRGNWKLWPFGFKRSKTMNIVQSTNESVNQVKPDAASMTMKIPSRDNDMQKHMIPKKKVRWLTPNSEELASLNLKEGPNVVTFSFLTAMLGRQQVDARIYLWKWNTQIVISDVDGTITRSDVLGQFMPLVGMDWSQTGVTHLFSAIKENGYQLLFLSARAISQAYLTRQFLFNLKQDGKVLPHGPVVISPDGLFPSLYREVIRRAPHEFKISCLEAIRALFPTECNPFYAGFGNRDTDEISYLKVGIPRGKIFIINPKGEVAVNRRIDTKSYSSLQALVNVMFPPMSSWEQEDFNSWNYWKMPFPDIVI